MPERPHGFRSSFRDWCAEATGTPREVAEAALAHSDGTKTELAYRRTDFLEQRRVADGTVGTVRDGQWRRGCYVQGWSVGQLA